MFCQSYRTKMVSRARHARKLMYYLLMCVQALVCVSVTARHVDPDLRQISSRVVNTRYGSLRGFMSTLSNRQLHQVEVFLGVPYAGAPTGPLRFMPPVTSPHWKGVRLADHQGPVCPQKFPDISNETESLKRMPIGRYKYLKRLLPQLMNQSEDCLYLNIYVPATEYGEISSTEAIVRIHPRETPTYSDGVDEYNGNLDMDAVNAPSEDHFGSQVGPSTVHYPWITIIVSFSLFLVIVTILFLCVWNYCKENGGQKRNKKGKSQKWNKKMEKPKLSPEEEPFLKPGAGDANETRLQIESDREEDYPREERLSSTDESDYPDRFQTQWRDSEQNRIELPRVPTVHRQNPNRKDFSSDMLDSRQTSRQSRHSQYSNARLHGAGQGDSDAEANRNAYRHYPPRPNAVHRPTSEELQKTLRRMGINQDNFTKHAMSGRKDYLPNTALHSLPVLVSEWKREDSDSDMPPNPTVVNDKTVTPTFVPLVGVQNDGDLSSVVDESSSDEYRTPPVTPSFFLPIRIIHVDSTQSEVLLNERNQTCRYFGGNRCEASSGSHY